MSDEKRFRSTADEVPEDERPTEDMDDEDEATEELTPAQRRAFSVVVRGLSRLAKLLGERDSSFSAGPVSAMDSRAMSWSSACRAP